MSNINAIKKYIMFKIKIKKYLCQNKTKSYHIMWNMSTKSHKKVWIINNNQTK